MPLVAVPTSPFAAVCLSTREARRHSLQKGFTLLEMLLVVAVVGLLAFVVVAYLPERQQMTTTSSARQQFQLKFHYAREQALLRNWVIGVELKPSSYRFYRWHQGQWQEVVEKPLLPVELAEYIELDFIQGRFYLADNLATADGFFNSDTHSNEEKETAIKPQIIIFSSTEFTPFKLQWLTLSPNAVSGPLLQIDGSDGMQLQLVENELW